MYQLLSQVAGRAGRAEKPGIVYVQTWRPEHPAIRHARTHDFRAFAREELRERELLLFPPFSRMVVFHFKSPSASRVQSVAHKFCEVVRKITSENVVMGPSPSVIEWLSGQYQWEGNIKLDRRYSANSIRHLLDTIFEEYDAVKPKGAAAVRISVAVDAIEEGNQGTLRYGCLRLWAPAGPLRALNRVATLCGYGCRGLSLYLERRAAARSDLSSHFHPTFCYISTVL